MKLFVSASTSAFSRKPTGPKGAFSPKPRFTIVLPISSDRLTLFVKTFVHCHHCDRDQDDLQDYCDRDLLPMFLKSLTGPHILLRGKVLEFWEQGKNLGRRCEQPGGDHKDGINDEIYDGIGDGIDDEINDNDSSLDKHGDPGGLQLSTDSLPLALQQEPGGIL